MEHSRSGTSEGPAEWLGNHWRALGEIWLRTCELWDDRVRRQFERDFWQEYEAVVPATMKAMDRLEEVMARALREVQ